MTPVLEISRYTLDYATRQGPFRALEDVTLSVGKGEVVGLVGESGSGKTSLAWAIMRYLAANAIERAGTLLLSGTDLRALSPRDLSKLRGARIGMVFQDPSTSLNPTLTLGRQITEVLEFHRGLSPADAAREAEAMFARVGLRDPAALMRRYPHEASGGEKQRVVIATAFACRPDCILFDEPTTALDVITARQILDLFRELQADTGVASLYISHDLAVVSGIAQRVAVIQGGRIVEQGPTAQVFGAPRSDYTRMLLAAVPRPEIRLTTTEPGTGAPLVEADRVTVRYGRPSFFRRRSAGMVGAADVSLSVQPGEILGIVGESGSGKSTMARALTGLAGHEGALRFDGKPLTVMGRDYRRQVQIVFQHPDSSLNPRQRVREILSRPLALYGSERSTDAAIAALLESVNLPADFADRFPHQLSGGQKQRVAIARAFAPRPRLVICDEVTSSLDVSVQAGVVRLLVDLQRDTGAAYLFISHDINLVRQIAHRIAVMHRGRVVETIGVDDLATRGPPHPYTAELIAAVPRLILQGASHVA
ncbi:dipeptide ABC transporter ATP-binding protein [Falsiroseomonas sp. HW251]|uniref:dipeptide ABC transporter ATP-binding protein n=1 Tax=Falsiroseomonas sp. HW251 TaxID=3390998 RepID=UPI003D317674